MNTIKLLAFLAICCICVYISLAIGDENILCDSTSCDKTKCDDIPAKCKDTNTTNPGIYMLSPDICNCCQFCMVNLGKGDVCSVGDPSNGRHTSICGPGLGCVATKVGQSDGTCQKLSTVCTQNQADYDTRRNQGFLGQMEARATCDDDGLFGSYKCIPGQTCYCLHSNGSRIFGDADYSPILNYMSCECSQKYYDAVDLLGRSLAPHEHFRCSANGNYDKLQCINEKCLCVDEEDGAPTYPDRSLVNITEISQDTLSCYTSTVPGQYYKKCETEYMKVYREVQDLKKQGYSIVFGFTFPKCDLDGSYQAIQENKTHKYCVDKDGSILIALNKTENATLVADMDCKCARAKMITTTSDKPDCSENGNYNPVQCRRGTCRCVDVDGNQSCSSAAKQCEEVDEIVADQLPCY